MKNRIIFGGLLLLCLGNFGITSAQTVYGELSTSQTYFSEFKANGQLTQTMWNGLVEKLHTLATNHEPRIRQLLKALGELETKLSNMITEKIGTTKREIEGHLVPRINQLEGQISRLGPIEDKVKTLEGQISRLGPIEDKVKTLETRIITLENAPKPPKNCKGTFTLQNIKYTTFNLRETLIHGDSRTLTEWAVKPDNGRGRGNAPRHTITVECEDGKIGLKSHTYSCSSNESYSAKLGTCGIACSQQQLCCGKSGKCTQEGNIRHGSNITIDIDQDTCKTKSVTCDNGE